MLPTKGLRFAVQSPNVIAVLPDSESEVSSATLGPSKLKPKSCMRKDNNHFMIHNFTPHLAFFHTCYLQYSFCFNTTAGIYVSDNVLRLLFIKINLSKLLYCSRYSPRNVRSRSSASNFQALLSTPLRLYTMCSNLRKNPDSSNHGLQTPETMQ